jgi:hypothetical protein
MSTPNHIHPTCNPQQLPRTRRRNGNIARLPQNLRDTVNSMLDDGIPYDTIIAKLRDHGFSICRSNLTHWRNGGYQDYLQERISLKEMRTSLDFIADLLRDNAAGQIPEAALHLSALRLAQFLRDSSVAAANGEAHADSTAFIRAANAACRLSEVTNHLKSLKSTTGQSNQEPA